MKRQADPKKLARRAKMQKFFLSRGWQVYGAGACLMLTAVLILIVGLCLDSYWTGRLDKLEQDLQMQVEQAAADAAQAKADRDAAAEEEDGRIMAGYESEIGSGRRMEDDRIVADMISHATTWSSRRTYEESRAELLSHYEWLNMASNPDFLGSFFPPGEDLYSTLDGVVLADPLEDGRNITFGSISTYLIGTDGAGNRYYFAEAATQSSGQVGGTATGRLVMTYESRADGSIWDLKCYVM